jgi:hypothetical protein
MKFTTEAQRTQSYIMERILALLRALCASVVKMNRACSAIS